MFRDAFGGPGWGAMSPKTRHEKTRPQTLNPAWFADAATTQVWPVLRYFCRICPDLLALTGLIQILIRKLGHPSKPMRISVAPVTLSRVRIGRRRRPSTRRRTLSSPQRPSPPLPPCTRATSAGTTGCGGASRVSRSISYQPFGAAATGEAPGRRPCWTPMATATGRYSNLDRSFKLAARSLLTAFSREVQSLPALADAGPASDMPTRIPGSCMWKGFAGRTCFRYELTRYFRVLGCQQGFPIVHGCRKGAPVPNVHLCECSNHSLVHSYCQLCKSLPYVLVWVLYLYLTVTARNFFF
jgi:hypothetical protein